MPNWPEQLVLNKDKDLSFDELLDLMSKPIVTPKTVIGNAITVRDLKVTTINANRNRGSL